MPKRRIFTIGFELPGAELEYVEFESDQTLLDADIVLFEPSLGDFDLEFGQQYAGKSILSHYHSRVVKERLNHWNSEIIEAVNAGKLVIIYLTKPMEYFRYTGEQTFSGTGRSQVTTNVVANISSYDAIPTVKSVKSKSGTAIRRDKDASFLASYWNEFADISPYEVEIEGTFNQIVLRSKSGERTVGAAHRGKRGTLLLLPPLGISEEKFTGERDGEWCWTEEALRFGKRLIAALIGMDDGLRQSFKRTPAPNWTLDSDYRMAEETDLDAKITDCTKAISELKIEKSELEEKLNEAGRLRDLLFEQGSPLETAVIAAMKLFGFEAEPFDDGESEFDVVFSCPEGRCLGEAEGKDNKAVNIQKFRQLEQNIQEDFERDEVTEFAKGVLFGNAFRLIPVKKREGFFTDKCCAAARRTDAALVRTTDLFEPARYLMENPSDEAYAKECRDAIFGAEGTVAVFPKIQIGTETSMTLGDEEKDPTPTLKAAN